MKFNQIILFFCILIIFISLVNVKAITENYNIDKINEKSNDLNITNNHQNRDTTSCSSALPNSFNWQTYLGKDWTTPAKNQGNIGSCWDFTAIGVIESVIEIRENCSNLNPDLSEQYVLSCLPAAGGDNYGAVQWVFDCIIDNKSRGNYCNGIITESCFPYQANVDIPCSEKSSDWEKFLIPLTNWGEFKIDEYTIELRDSVKELIMEKGPLGTYMWASNQFINWGATHHKSTDCFPYIYSDLMQNTHTIIIVGWKDDPSIESGGYWICKNSWGTNWGYDGFFNIAYDSLITGFNLYWVDYNPDDYDWAPIAEINGLYEGNTLDEIYFDSSSSVDAEGDINSYSWDFGDGNNATGPKVMHVYQEPGIYRISLTVTDTSNKSSTVTSLAGIDKQPINIKLKGGNGLNIEIENPSDFDVYNTKLDITLTGKFINIDYSSKIIDTIYSKSTYLSHLPLIGFGQGIIEISYENINMINQLVFIGPFTIVI